MPSNPFKKRGTSDAVVPFGDAPVFSPLQRATCDLDGLVPTPSPLKARHDVASTDRVRRNACSDIKGSKDKAKNGSIAI